MEYDNTNTGVLFSNTPIDGKPLHEKAPQMKGTLNVEGKEYEIAGWSRVSKAGKKFLSVKISEPFQKSEPSTQAEEPLDSLPF